MSKQEEILHHRYVKCLEVYKTRKTTRVIDEVKKTSFCTGR